ncbi:hypothetical protein GCM10009814_05500 [Lapillicoccus jejuensis]
MLALAHLVEVSVDDDAEHWGVGSVLAASRYQGAQDMTLLAVFGNRQPTNFKGMPLRPRNLALKHADDEAPAQAAHWNAQWQLRNQDRVDRTSAQAWVQEPLAEWLEVER